MAAHLFDMELLALLGGVGEQVVVGQPRHIAGQPQADAHRGFVRVHH